MLQQQPSDRHAAPAQSRSDMHTTNYSDTFITVADDCKVEVGLPPPDKQAKTVARRQFEIIQAHPYRYTSDEVIFTIHAERSGIPEAERADKRAAFFSKGQPCLRSSPLAKTYGWGIHYDGESRIAIYPRGSEEYDRLRSDGSIKQLKAMRSSK
jgi:hypothetical protein